jgi:hypothetical protein
MNAETAKLIIELGHLIIRIGESLDAHATGHDEEAPPQDAPQDALHEETRDEDPAPAEEPLDPDLEERMTAAYRSALNPDPDFHDPRLNRPEVWAPTSYPEGEPEALREVAKQVIKNILAVGGPNEGRRCVVRSLYSMRATKLSEVPDHLLPKAIHSLAYGCNQCRALKATGDLSDV